MRYALVSDIHANLQAWNTVLIDIRSVGVDRIICLGDIVGYGPNPAETLESVYTNVDDLVLGNHDAVICGKMDASLFNESARQVIEWTGRQLSRDALTFLSSLPLSLAGGLFRCAHGDFGEPAAFNYVIDPEDALASWQAVEEQLLFVGHTHRPAIFLLGRSDTPHMVDAQDFELEPEKRYLVNLGSVGQPRDGGTRACYCILDTDDKSVCWRHIPFDLDAFRAALERSGVATKPSYFLRHDPRIGTPPIRELLNFSPAKSPDEAVKNAVEVKELTGLKKSVRKWRTMFSLATTVAFVLAAGGGYAGWRHQNRAQRITSPEMLPVSALTTPVGRNLAAIPPRTAATPAPLPGWAVILGHRRRQGAKIVAPDNAAPSLVLKSATMTDEILVESPSIGVKPGMKLLFEAMLKKSPDFAGHVAAVVVLWRRGADNEEDFVVKEPNRPRNDGWGRVKKTFELPAGSSSINIQLRGNFTGTVEIRDINLTRKE